MQASSFFKIAMAFLKRKKPEKQTWKPSCGEAMEQLDIVLLFRNLLLLLIHKGSKDGVIMFKAAWKEKHITVNASGH